MNRQQVLQLVIAGILVILLVAGCGTPAATPVLPTATPSVVPPTSVKIRFPDGKNFNSKALYGVRLEGSYPNYGKAIVPGDLVCSIEGRQQETLISLDQLASIKIGSKYKKDSEGKDRILEVQVVSTKGTAGSFDCEMFFGIAIQMEEKGLDVKYLFQNDDLLGVEISFERTP